MFGRKDSKQETANETVEFVNRNQSAKTGKRGKATNIVLGAVVVIAILLVGMSCSRTGSSNSASTQASEASAPASAASSESAASSGAAAADYRANFIGTWDMTEYKDDNQTFDKKTLAEARKKGTDSYIVFNDDETATIVVGTNVNNYTWKATDSSNGIIENDTGRLPIYVEGNNLGIGSKNSYMFFEKGKARASLPAETSSESAAATDTGTSDDSPASDEVSPDLKEMLDSYEAFVDEYVEFMKNYQESGDMMSMLTEYTDYMQRYTDFMEKVENVDTSNMSTADYAYYIDVTSRISKKLLEVSGF